MEMIHLITITIIIITIIITIITIIIINLITKTKKIIIKGNLEEIIDKMILKIPTTTKITITTTIATIAIAIPIITTLQTFTTTPPTTPPTITPNLPKDFILVHPQPQTLHHNPPKKINLIQLLYGMIKQQIKFKIKNPLPPKITSSISNPHKIINNKSIIDLYSIFIISPFILSISPHYN
jgi:hypothetical protein